MKFNTWIRYAALDIRLVCRCVEMYFLSLVKIYFLLQLFAQKKNITSACVNIKLKYCYSRDKIFLPLKP